jgi:RNA polymerase sigma-70 factor, ECF subfamily
MDSEQHNTIETLIKRAKAGDNSAIGELYEQYVERIYRYIAYRVPNTEVDDLTAEVFLKMIEGLPNFTYTGAPFEAWLYRIASARVADYYRKSKRENTKMPETMIDPHLQPEEFFQQAQEMDRIRQALQKLSDNEQTLLILRFVERRKHEDVAEIMGKSLAAVRTMQHRALTKLADLVDADGKERHYIRGEESDKPL